MIFRAIPKRSEGGLKDILGEIFKKLIEGNVNDFQRKKASGVLATDLPTNDEKDKTHQVTTEIEPSLEEIL